MSEYEFTGEQNHVVHRLSLWARVAGILNLLLALMLAATTARLLQHAGDHRLLNVVEAAIAIGTALLTLLFGVWMLRAAGLFGQIVATQGSDVSLLMRAFRELAKIYRTQFWLYMIAFALVLVLIVVSIVLRVTGA